ncbi:MAG: sigma-54 dependent transcriptional regulator [Rhodoferax sp.]
MTASAHPTRLLVVDDEPDLRTLYELTLLRAGYQVEAAADLAQANTLLAEHRFDVVITDMRLPDGQGLSLIQQLRAAGRSERCIVITAYGSTQNAVDALKAGAFDYLTKPVDLSQFRSVVRAALDTPCAPALGVPSANGPPGGALGQRALDRLVGQSAVMRHIKERILKVAASMAPVMVNGESGTGKELVAYAIHANSHRAKGPWVAVNCSAIPETLLEAEFFGARKGAYTGAQADREGFFQAAAGGTLFLDEIGDLPLAMQSKLLRAIQERRIRPLGAPHEEAVDVRLVSATHKNLAQEVQAGRFRQDLYYRLNVIDLCIPPLRERLEDLPLLCQTLLARIAEESGQSHAPALRPEFLQRIARRALPGNVRELENLLYRAFALGDGTELWLDDDDAQPPTPPVPGAANAPPAPEQPPLNLVQRLDAIERALLNQALQMHSNDVEAAAAHLGLSSAQFQQRLRRLNRRSEVLPNAPH